jgi:hypothetical protein
VHPDAAPRRPNVILPSADADPRAAQMRPGASSMGSWIDVERDAAQHHGVTSARRAQELGVSAATFHRRTTAERGWASPHPGVRTSPFSVAGVKRDLLVAMHVLRGTSAAAGQAAAWLHDLRRWPPDRFELVVDHRGYLPALGTRYAVRRARWLRSGDVVELDGVPSLTASAMLVSAARWPLRELRALLIDALHRGLVTVPAVRARVGTVGPTAGVGGLRRLLDEFEARTVESVFHDDVLDELHQLGYRPSRHPVRIDTDDGRGVLADIALPWKIAVEPEGDSFHRTREQRRKDRRRAAQYAGTEWRCVPVDWRDWQLERSSVLAALDAAVLAQWRAGVGRQVSLPPHLQHR